MAYTITLSPSGHTYTCDPAVEILKAGLEAGMFMPYSCRSGMCNTCKGKVVEGRVDLGDVHQEYLPQAERDEGFALLCCARPLSDLKIEIAEIDAGEAIRPKYMPARILKMDRAASDVMIVALGLPMNEPTIFRAGQYVDFVREGGDRRSYSIASTPGADGLRSFELHMRHSPGGKFTDRVFGGAMKLREMHKIEAPLGSFFLRDKSDKPMVMLASGTGFAPIKSIINDSLKRGFTRPITLYWGGRKREDLYQAAQCEAWAAENAHIAFVPVLSDATPQCKWTGRTGFVHRAVMEDFPDLSAYQVYACGAPIVIDSARSDFVAKCKLPADEFFADSFITEKEKAAA